MRVVVGIPARLSSTRFPRKLLAPLAGEPVLAHTIRRAQEAALGPVLVATDSEEIAALAGRMGVQARMTSPEHPNGAARLAEAMADVEADVVVNLQGDEPFAPVAALRAVAEALREDPEAAIATVATPLRDPDAFEDPHQVKVVVDARGHALYFSRAPIPHGAPELALGHLGIYAYRREALLRYAALPPAPLERAERLEQLRALAHGMRIRVVVGEFASVGIDTPADLARAEALGAGMAGRGAGG